MTLSLREVKHVTNDVKFPPVAPKEFKAKPFFFRKTILDSCYRKKIYNIKGCGSFGYLQYHKKRITLFKTDNYHLALSKNMRLMDIQAPTKSHTEGMDVYRYTIYKLLRRLENYVHFMTHFLATKSDYIMRLSLSVRKLMSNLKFSALSRLFKTINLNGKRRKPTESVYPYPTIVGIKGASLPKAKPISVESSSELSYERGRNVDFDDSSLSD